MEYCKNEKSVLTFGEMLHYINAMGEDFDIYVDGLDGLAVVGGDIRFTPAGLEKFSPVFDMPMSAYMVTGTAKDYEDLEAMLEHGRGDGGRLKLAYDLIWSLAGYCSCEQYEKWFEGLSAKPI